MPNPFARRIALAALLLAAAPAHAAVEHEYDPDTTAGPPLTTWWVRDTPAARKADQDYVSGMVPHHAGALSMSREYLADPQASSQVLISLAQGIIRNQGFEIAVLDQVAQDLRRPARVLDLGLVRIPVRQAATEGLAQRLRFLRSPIPSLLDGVSGRGGRVSARDVQFAKAMMLHHQAAVEMADGYLANPHANNGYLGLLNIDIAWDQRQEITLMRQVIALYPGNPDTVRIDPSMVHGMDGMGHGGHGAPPPAPAPVPSMVAPVPQPAAAGPPSRAVAPAGHAHHH